MDSRRSLLNYDGLDASRALAFFEDEAQELDEESLFLWMRAHPFDDLVVLDVTASEELAGQYLDFASYGFHVISANKLAGASCSDTYRQIRDAFAKTGRHWLYNATVGAGLPVNHTVRDLRDSGDSILAISGIFSGTLSRLFLQYDGTVPFTELVDQAAAGADRTGSAGRSLRSGRDAQAGDPRAKRATTSNRTGAGRVAGAGGLRAGLRRSVLRERRGAEPTDAAAL